MSEQDEGARIQSLSALSEKVDRLTGLVEKFIGGAHTDATATTQEHLDQPGSIAEEMQREFARRDQMQSAAEKEAARDADIGSIKETVKAMQEKPPEVPLNWGGKAMGWKR